MDLLSESNRKKLSDWIPTSRYPVYLGISFHGPFGDYFRNL